MSRSRREGSELRPVNQATALWQAEADLLADGREQLERLCAKTRYRHLFPTGPNLALLFQAYQELDRWRTVNRRDRLEPKQQRQDRRRFRRLLKRMVQADALARDRRLLWKYPTPRPQLLRLEDALVREALENIDSDAKADVAAKVYGRPRAEPGPSASVSAADNYEGRLHRGLQQFREALINAALAHPTKINRLHPQFLTFIASPPPKVRKHPIATLVLVKLPLQLLMILVLLFNIAYLAAYWFFNDERLGAFLTAKIGGLIDGELEFESLHWSPMLIVDLVTGRPHTLQGYGLSVWEGYKIDGVEKSRRTAYAEHVEVDLVIHEIIPWNRLGVPKLVEIPWVLHFTEIENKGELWVDVRAYQNPHRNNEWMLSLIDAFRPAKELDPPPHLKRLSYRIDHAQLDGVVVDIDMVGRAGWGTRLELDEVEARLDFEAWAPIEPDPERLPLRYDVNASGGAGDFAMLAIYDERIAIADVRELELTSGMDMRPVGDLWIAGDADLGGSPSKFEGRLIDVFGDLVFDYRIATTDIGPLGGMLMPAQTDEETGEVRPMLVANGSPASVEITGPADDLVLEAVGQGLMLDLFPDPSWVIYDVDVSLMLAKDPLPERWAGLDWQPPASGGAHRSEGGLPGEGDDEGPLGPAEPQPGEPGAQQPATTPTTDDERWIVYLDTFRGSALDGSLRLHRRGYQDHVVLGGEGQPLLVSIYLDLLGVDLGQLVTDQPDIAAMLRGDTRGGLQIHEVVIDDDGLDRVEAELHRVRIARERGPEDDGIPRNIGAEGEVIWDDDDGLDLRGLKFSVEGGQLRLSGGIDAAFETLRPTSASIRVDDGEAFLRAFGFPRWFDRLAVDFNLAGPLTNPSGSGTLDVEGAGTGSIAVDDIQAAELRFDRGTLELRSPEVALLGGHGPLEVDAVLLSNGKPLDDPRLRVDLRLEDINRADLLGSGIGVGDATVNLVIDDGNDKPIKLSQLQARGSAYADTLAIAGVDFRDAEANFAFTREGIQLDSMTLAYHRPVSPALQPGVTVPVGRVSATGSIGFDDDPALALVVDASSVPLSAIAATLGEDLPVRGQIAKGSHLEVSGSLRRPQVEGQLVLTGLGAAGIPLGSGTLEFSSLDVEAQPPAPEQGRLATAAHRQVQVEGKLSGGPARHPEDGQLEWSIDATVAFGGSRENPIEAAIDLDVHNLPLDSLLVHPSRSQWRDHIVGGMHELEIRTRYCPTHGPGVMPLLGECAMVPVGPEPEPGEGDDPLRIDLELAHFWYREARSEQDADAPAGDPCLDPAATCSVTPLVARLDGTLLTLDEPWVLRSGGRDGAQLKVEGRFDLSSEEPTLAASKSEQQPEPGPSPEEHRAPEVAVSETRRCIPGVPDNATLPEGLSAASVSGQLDLVALAPLVGPMGVRSPDGRLDINLNLAGLVARPTVTGSVRLAEGQALELSFDDEGDDEKARRRRERPIPIEIAKLDLSMAGGTVYLDGALRVFDETLRFGTIGTRPTYLDLAGPCSGRFGVAVAGTVDGTLVHRLVPDLVDGSGGAAELRDVYVAGDIARFGEDASDEPLGPDGPTKPYFDVLRGVLSFDRKAIRLGVPEVGELRLTSGEVEFRQCTPARPCGPKGFVGPSGPNGTPDRLERGIAIWLGGERGARAASRPSSAVSMRVGERGNAQFWGELVIDDRFEGLDRAVLTSSLTMFPVSLADNSGRTELEAALSSEKLIFETDGINGSVTGKVLIERSIWLRDARQGVAVLSFADPSPAPPSQLPEFIRDLDLNLELQTTQPFRVDNNVAKNLEARADLRLAGTVGDPQLSGEINVESGVIDIDILGGAYDVKGGTVSVNEDIEKSEISVEAARQKQIKVNNQLLTLHLSLTGTLDAIQWECTAPGDTSGALATARGCVDYLIFDAGNLDVAKSDIRENRNNNLLGTRFLPLAGRLTQVELNEVLAREIPRVEPYLPYMRFRIDQVGLLTEFETRPEWLRWGWGRLGLNFTYLRGYPGSVIRDSRSVSGRLEILENLFLEAAFTNRSYTNRVLILDPARGQSIELRNRLEFPSPR